MRSFPVVAALAAAVLLAVTATPRAQASLVHGSDDGARSGRSRLHRRDSYDEGHVDVVVDDHHADLAPLHGGAYDAGHHVDVIEPIHPMGGHLAAHEDHALLGGGIAPLVGPGHYAGSMFAMPVLDPAHLSHNSFYAGEIFAMYNPEKGTCLAVEPDDERPKLVTTRCSLHQHFVANSLLAFHWLPTPDNNLAHLAIIYEGRRLCAVSKFTGTYFYPCTSKSIKYSLSATNEEGTFAIRDAGRSSQCMDAEFHHALRMKHCSRHFDDQKWMKIHILFL